ncbi:MAG TPA: HDIG domain-containing protein [Kiritimatiellia bacterium]|nr:HDIG domain-containing protein [Kiritimatiellia bacterium]HNS81250.1 HDIG domain-containing protein [Kiritimatiellia bacterium]
MAALISKTRSIKSRQRDREERKSARRPWPVACILLVFFLWLATLVTLHVGGTASLTPLAPGQLVTEAVISKVDFKCVDLAETEMSRRRAEDAVLPVFKTGYEKYADAIRTLEKLFRHLGDIRNSGDQYPSRKEKEQAVEKVLDLLGIVLDPAAFLKAVPEGREQEVLGLVSNTLRKAYSGGIVSEADLSSSFKGLVRGSHIQIQQEDGTLRRVSFKGLASPVSALASAVAAMETALELKPSGAAVWRDLLRPWVVPSLVYQSDTTEQLRQEAADAVPPAETLIRTGTVLVEAGATVDAAVSEKLRAHARRLEELMTPLDRFLRMIADASLLMIALMIMAGLLQVFKSPLLTTKGHLMLVVILSLLTIVTSKGMLHFSGFEALTSSAVLRYLAPVALTSLLATILLDAGVGMAAGLWTSVAVALLFGRSFSVLMLGLLVTSVSVQTAQNVHRRANIFRVGLWVGLAGSLFALTSAVLMRYPLSLAMMQMAAVFASGMLCAILALMLIPLFEVLFNLTTDIRLLELSDLSNPLLQRLSIEAPGTYHHSMMVANIAHAAAQEIGARALLVRVGAYFHDIGKLTKPEFFVENIQLRENPHDDLAPSMSTLVVTSHVKEGVALARRHKLPQIVIDAIEQHHGTSVVTYFYHRARAQQESEKDGSANAAVKEADFRYTGPRPVSREMGILALADSVEAASRSMDKPTAARIESLVREIIDRKLLDGQLDNCQLTMADLAAVRKSFIFTLTNMLHGRVPYPQDESRNKQQTAKKPDEPSPNQEAPDLADGTGAGGQPG